MFIFLDRIEKEHKERGKFSNFILPNINYQLNSTRNHIKNKKISKSFLPYDYKSLKNDFHSDFYKSKRNLVLQSQFNQGNNKEKINHERMLKPNNIFSIRNFSLNRNCKLSHEISHKDLSCWKNDKLNNSKEKVINIICNKKDKEEKEEEDSLKKDMFITSGKFFDSKFKRKSRNEYVNDNNNEIAELRKKLSQNKMLINEGQEDLENILRRTKRTKQEINHYTKYGSKWLI